MALMMTMDLQHNHFSLLYKQILCAVQLPGKCDYEGFCLNLLALSFV
jgi:hypothetical protein